MSARLYLTVYEADDLNGTSIGTVNEASELEYKHNLHGTGSLSVTINRHHAQADLLQRDRYVRVHTDGGIVGGAFLEEGTIALSDSEGKGGETITWTGRGQMAILDRGVMDTDSDITGGHDPIEGFWDLSAQGPLAGNDSGHPIPMLKRALVEAQLQSPNGIPLVDHSSFDYDTDSASVAIPNLPGVFGVDIGDDILTVMGRMAQLGGVTWVMDDEFKLDAYQTYGTDQSGSFGASTVRFEKGVNIADAIGRKVRGAVERTHLIVGGANRSFVTVVDPAYTSGVVRWGFLSVSETEDPDQLEAAGLSHIAARKRQTDTFTFPQHDHGDSPANGIYEPSPSGGHYWVGDTVTLHTGTGAYDSNNGTAGVAAITWQLKTGGAANGDYWVIPEIGSTFHWQGGPAWSDSCCGGPGSQHQSNPGPVDTPGTPAVPPTTQTGSLTATDHEQIVTDGTPAAWTTVSNNLARAGIVHSTFGGIGGGCPVGAGQWSGQEDRIAGHSFLVNSLGGAVDHAKLSYSWSYDGQGTQYGPFNVYVAANVTSPPAIGALSGATFVGSFTGGSGSSPASGTEEFTIPGAFFVVGQRMAIFIKPDWTTSGTVCAGSGADGRSSTMPGTGQIRETVGSSAGAVIELFADAGTPAVPGGTGDLVPASEFGQTPTAGTSDDYMRSDATAGTPELGGVSTVPIDATNVPTAGDILVVTSAPTSTTAVAAWKPNLASSVSVVDTDGNFVGSNVEAALAELAGSVGAATSVVTDHGSMGAAETFDFTDGSDHEGVQDANLTVTLTGATDGQAAFLTLALAQDGTGGWTLTLPGSVVNASDIETAWVTTAGTTNVLSLFSYDGGANWYGFLAGGSSVGALDDLSDVTITSSAAADRLRYDGSGWVNSNLHWEPMVTYDGIVMLDSGGNPHMHEVSH